MRYFLGVDGGGSKTAAVILDEQGVERGRGEGGPGNVATNEDGALLRSLDSAVEAACMQAGLYSSVRFEGVCAGIAGYSVETRRHAFSAILRTQVASDYFRIEPDYLVAFWGATHGEPGIVVIAGTGAVTYGQNAEGQSYREDGLGYLLGDKGSGFNLGLRALRYTLEQIKLGSTDPLSEAVLTYTSAKCQGDIVHWLYGNFSPDKVAALAPLVGSLAEAGDPAACSQIAEMAKRLRNAVRQTRHRLWLPWDAPVYPLGGLWRLGPFLRSEFADPQWEPESHLSPREEEAPNPKLCVVEAKNDPAYGAALMAMRRV